MKKPKRKTNVQPTVKEQPLSAAFAKIAEYLKRAEALRDAIPHMGDELEIEDAGQELRALIDTVIAEAFEDLITQALAEGLDFLSKERPPYWMAYIMRDAEAARLAGT